MAKAKRKPKAATGRGGALSIEHRKVDDLIPYARNARTHDYEQVAQIAASIREFGWTNPVLIDGDNGIIAGHGRLLAAYKLNMKEVPVIVLTHLSETQRRAYVLADNKLALNAGWDDELLEVELTELKDLGFDLELVGFDEKEINKIFGAGLEENASPGDVVGGDRHLLMIEYDSEQELQAAYEEQTQRGANCKILS